MSYHDRSRSVPARLLAVCLALVATGPQLLSMAQGQEEPKQDEPASGEKKSKNSSLDDALLDDLDNELLEGVGSMKDRAKSKSADATNPKGNQPGEAQPLDGDDVGMPSEDEDPLQHISQSMRSVEELIPKSSDRPLAEEMQKKIVEELNLLIDQAEQQRAQQKPSQSKSRQKKSVNERQQVQQPKQADGTSGKDSNKPAQDSTDRLGKADAARPDPAALKGLMKDSWGHLPARAREQMLQNTPDKFLPQYELMIEKYYKRLAEDDGP